MPGFASFAGLRGALQAPSLPQGSVSSLSVPSLLRPIAALLLILAVASALAAQPQGPHPGAVVLRA